MSAAVLKRPVSNFPKNDYNSSIGGDTMCYSATYAVDIFRDEEAGVWVAVSDEIPLALESNLLETLKRRVKIAAPEILSLNGVLLTNDLDFVFNDKGLIPHGGL